MGTGTLEQANVVSNNIKIALILKKMLKGTMSVFILRFYKEVFRNILIRC